MRSIRELETEGTKLREAMAEGERVRSSLLVRLRDRPPLLHVSPPFPEQILFGSNFSDKKPGRIVFFGVASARRPPRAMRTRQEFADRLRERDDRVRDLETEGTKLREAMAEGERVRSSLIVRLRDRNDDLARLHRLRSSSSIIGRSLRSWSRWSVQQRLDRSRLRFAAAFRRRRLLRRCFAPWSAPARSAVRDRRVERAAGVVVGRYESELGRLRIELDGARRGVEEEARSRRRLEEDVRGTLLRGMTAVNVEAVRLLDGQGGMGSAGGGKGALS